MCMDDELRESFISHIAANPLQGELVVGTEGYSTTLYQNTETEPNDTQILSHPDVPLEYTLLGRFLECLNNGCWVFSYHR